MRTGAEDQGMTIQSEPSLAIPKSGAPAAVDGEIVLRHRSPRLLALVTALVWLVPLLLLEVAAWQTWRMEIDDAGSDVQNVLTVLTEQAEQVFQAQAMALSWIDPHGRGGTGEEMGPSAELHTFTTIVSKH